MAQELTIKLIEEITHEIYSTSVPPQEIINRYELIVNGPSGVGPMGIATLQDMLFNSDQPIEACAFCGTWREEWELDPDGYCEDCLELHAA